MHNCPINGALDETLKTKDEKMSKHRNYRCPICGQRCNYASIDEHVALCEAEHMKKEQEEQAKEDERTVEVQTLAANLSLAYKNDVDAFFYMLAERLVPETE